MRRSRGPNAVDFFRNLYQEMPYLRWWRTLVANRIRAKIVLGCCGHPGEPGC